MYKRQAASLPDAGYEADVSREESDVEADVGALSLAPASWDRHEEDVVEEDLEDEAEELDATQCVSDHTAVTPPVSSSIPSYRARLLEPVSDEAAATDISLCVDQPSSTISSGDEAAGEAQPTNWHGYYSPVVATSPANLPYSYL